jgi:diaminopimelate epimerase
VIDPLAFAKYHGTGNDFVMVLDLEDERPLSPAEIAAICDRRRGVGADGVIRVVRAQGGPRLFMDYANADGSVAEMCGNGIRCVAALALDRGLVEERSFDVATRAGVKHLEVHAAGDGGETSVTVGMGAANFTKAAIPMRGPAWETFVGQPLEIAPDLVLTASAVSMGNPHLVLFVEEDPERYHIEHLGPALEHHEWFPERVNVEFARVQDEATIDARVWERGVGETLSCGTGACAVVVAAHEAGLVPSRATVRFRGGSLTVERRDDAEVLLGGPVAHVFDGVVDPDALA